MTTILNDNILLLESSQEYKEILINQSTRILSIFVRGIQDKDLTTPPTPSNVDDYYIVASGATGAWSGKDNQIAIPAIDSNNNIIAGSWGFIVPINGLRVWVIDESIEYRFNGTNWVANTQGNVPLGGSTGQGLLKNSNVDGDYTWQDLSFDALNQVLTGFSESVSATAILATDTILQAFGKTQKYITDYLTNFNGANQLVKLNGSGQLPAIDGSQLTNLPSGSGAVDSVNSQTGTVVLDADDIDDTVTTNKFATQAELDAIAQNTSDIAALQTTENFFHIENPIPKVEDITLIQSARWAMTIDSIVHQMTSGTVTFSLKIETASVTGISSITATTSEATSTATANNVLNIGDKLILSITSVSSPSKFSADVYVTT